MTNIRKVEGGEKDKPLGGDFATSKLAFLVYNLDRWELRCNNILKGYSIGYRQEDHARGKDELLQYGKEIGYRVFES